MVETLKDLKDNHHVVGVKAEFEAEGTSFEEAAFCLIRSVRQAIFCLTNMINHIEYDKKQEIGELGQFIVQRHAAVIDDADKI